MQRRSRLATILSAAAAVLPSLAAQVSVEPRIVAGRVFGPSGETVPAAEVWVTHRLDPDGVVGRGMTDGSGRFRIRVRVGTPAPLEVHARAPGFTQALAVDDPRRPVGARTLLSLWPAATVRGRVRDHDGAPVAGAVVAAGPVRSLGLQIETVQTRTDRDGRYVLEHAPLGEVWLSAWTPARPLVRRSALLEPGHEEDFAFADEAPLALEIALTGLPAAGAAKGLRCVLVGNDMPLPAAMLHSVFEESDRLRVSGLPADEGLWAYVIDPERRWSCAPVVWSRSSLPFEVACTPTAVRRWEVAVRKPDGTPLGGVDIELGLDGEFATTSTDGDGKAAIEVRCGDEPLCSARLCSEAWVLSTVDDLQEPAPWYHGGGLQPMTFDAVRAARARGRLVDASGEPLAACDVLLEEHNPMRVPRWRPLAHSRTGEDGRFAMDRVLPLQHELRLRIEDTATLLLLRKALTAGATLDLGDVTAEPSGTVEGVVLGASGRPIPGARLFLQQAGQPRTGDRTELLCDRDGRFRFAPAASGIWIARICWRDDPPEHVGEPFRVRAGEQVMVELQASRR